MNEEQIDKSRLYVGSTVRVWNAMLGQVLAGVPPKDVLADYEFEWDRGPDLEPVAKLMLEKETLLAALTEQQSISRHYLAERDEARARVIPYETEMELSAQIDAMQEIVDVALKFCSHPMDMTKNWGDELQHAVDRYVAKHR